MLNHSHYYTNNLYCDNQFIKFFITQSMDSLSTTMSSKKTSPLILSVVSSLTRNQLIPIPSTSNQFSLYRCNQKKMTLTASTILIPKSKLPSNLQMYEWRFQTQFPIVKTIYVNVKQNQNNQTQTVEVEVYNQYCPFNLSQISDLPIGQCLYLLKQSIVGFQRLFHRYGGFEITNTMITINQKGCCKVWLHQNFSNNNFIKKQLTQKQMVNKIINIIQFHSQLSKIAAKLFTSLNACTTFLTTLRAVEQFAKQQKTIVPCRFTMLSSHKQNPKTPNTLCCKFIKNTSKKFPPKQDKKANNNQQGEDQPTQKQAKSNNCVPLKRIKSNIMKVSDGETAHTGKKNKTSNVQIVQNESTGNKPFQNLNNSYNTSQKCLFQSSYIMEEQLQAEPKQTKNKKELSCSEPFNQNDDELTHDVRRYSLIQQNGNNKQQVSINSKDPFFSIQSINEPYFSQFTNFLGFKQLQTKIQQIDQQQQDIKYHSGIIFKNNGWTSSVQGLFNTSTNLKKSVHQGKEDDVSISKKDIKLEKLGLIGRQEMYTSVLSDEYS